MSVRLWLRRWLLDPQDWDAYTEINLDLPYYESTLTQLEAHPDATLLLDLLLMRDRIALGIERGKLKIAAVKRLSDLDKRLARLAAVTTDAQWRSWRQVVGPPPVHWWWYVDVIELRNRDKSHIYVTVLTILLLVIAICLFFYSIPRFWGYSPDLIAVLGLVLPLALTFGAITLQNRITAFQTPDNLMKLNHSQGLMAIISAAFAFAIMVVITLLIPSIAVHYNNLGYADLRQGNLTSAQLNFQRAVNLNPKLSAAYYNLADSYVEIGDDEQAIKSYIQALSYDHTLDLAYSGLGYVYILKNEPERAVPILYTGIGFARDDVAKSALWTNLGRAYQETGRFTEAVSALKKALEINPKEASAYCALAISLDGRIGVQDDVVSYWEDCLRYADTTTSRGEELAAMARAHLQEINLEK